MPISDDCSAIAFVVICLCVLQGLCGVPFAALVKVWGEEGNQILRCCGLVGCRNSMISKIWGTHPGPKRLQTNEITERLAFASQIQWSVPRFSAEIGF